MPEAVLTNDADAMRLALAEARTAAAAGDVPVGAVVSEYVDVAKAFFDGREAGFANGLLDAIGKDVRKAN